MRRDDLLTDGGVRLRTWNADDAPAIVAGLRDGSAAYWIVGMPHPYGPAEAADFLARAERELQAAEYAHLAVADAADGRVLGAIGLNFHHDRQAGEIGYWTNPGDRGRGIARRAVALVTRWAFEELRLPRVELIIHPLNHESQVIASRGGFRREGLLRSYLEHRGMRNDYYSFARLPDDPEVPPHPVLEIDLPTPRSPAAGTPGSSALLLRPWRMGDAEAAADMIDGDEEISRWCLGIPDPCRLEDERAWVAETARLWTEHGAPNFAIVGTDAEGPRRLLGSIGCRPAAAPHTVEIGYLIDRQTRGRGMATMALRAVTDWALVHGGFRACRLAIHPDDAASARVADKAGYERTDEVGVIHDRFGRDGRRQVWRRSAG